MNKQPVDYKQYDSRWANMDYSAVGEKTDIRESGCGPTCAAMVIESVTGKKFTPADACAWSLKHGYKACGQGTYYSYFVPQFKQFGIPCERLNTANLYGCSGSLIIDKAFKLLREGWYIIACMGKGTWTSSGHFVLVWWEDGAVRINDPASTRAERLNGDVSVFRRQIKYLWAMDARTHNKNGKAVEDKEVDTVKVELPVLKQGMTGGAVLTWQQVLTAKGYDPKGLDGSFGPGCKAATVAYQKDHGLKADGSVGPEVYGSIWPK